MIHIIKAALPMCAQTEKATFLCKDDYRANLYIYVWSVGKGLETADNNAFHTRKGDVIM